ncbi:Uncharacterised protein [Rhodococcus erythropolis]|nr:Uncharacterised protein [Rhodococcus erythropolis]
MLRARPSALWGAIITGSLRQQIATLQQFIWSAAAVML